MQKGEDNFSQYWPGLREYGGPLSLTNTCCCPGRSTTHILTTELKRKTKGQKEEKGKRKGSQKRPVKKEKKPLVTTKEF